MYETSKAVQRRLHDPNFLARYFRGVGIDIGSGNDPLTAYRELFPFMDECASWDKENGDAETMPGLAAESFDFVHASHVLEDMRNPPAALARWFAILKPGGHLIITVPDEDMYEQGTFPSRFNADHKWSFTVLKTNSWGKFSISLLNLIAGLGDAADVIKIEQLTGSYRYGLIGHDQTRTPVGESAIEFVLRKRTKDEVEAGGWAALNKQPPQFFPSHITQAKKKPAIALHRPGAYGDIIMTLSLVPLLKQKYPGNEIHYYCNAGIGQNLAGLMKAAGVDRGAASETLAPERYDRVFNLIGYPLQEGYPEKPMAKHLIRYFAAEMGLDDGFALMPHLTLTAPPRPPTLPERYVTIHPSAGWSVYKNWRKERWEEVITDFPEIAFYQIGSDSDVKLKGARHDFMGGLFYNSIALMANADLHVGIDSWTNHLTNIEWEGRGFTPALILWGSTQWQAAGYMRNTNISLNLSCQPCFREDPKISRMPRGPCINPEGQVYERPQHACMHGITVERVVEEIKKLWRN